MSEQKYNWFTFIASLFVTTLIVSNIIAVKLLSFWGFIIPAGVILFPITYIVVDILTEVYGYERARQVIWIGFLCNLIAVGAIWLAGILPSAPFWKTQAAYDSILGFAPRLLLASFIAYLFGEFLNSYILAKLKVMTKGRLLWVRTIGSTIAGQGVDSAIFIVIAFSGVMRPGDLIATILSQWAIKVSYEALATPLTYFAVNRLKAIEKVDHFDTDTNFNPLRK